MEIGSATRWTIRLQRWAEGDPNIRLGLLVGSQARHEKGADRFSDIDLALFARDPEHLLRDGAWVAELGGIWTSHLESNALESGPERRVLFDDGQDVDFAVFPLDFLRVLTSDVRALSVLRRGFQILVNKDAYDLRVPPGDAPPTLPSGDEFTNLINDYWFHLIWTAKKLRRGELMTALESTNGYLRGLLVRAARWQAVGRGDERPDTWHGTRFFEEWADPRVLRELPGTVARYEASSIASALRTHRALLEWLSDALCRGFGFPAPVRDPARLSRFLDELLEEGGH
ncbi:MAG: aminoglycoside 6-adenylyltransferase [Thermoplasmata archaeon]|nr:aminoglycoside 6-adenylyltransferase [Thermoplasmata archaeon]